MSFSEVVCADFNSLCTTTMFACGTRSDATIGRYAEAESLSKVAKELWMVQSSPPARRLPPPSPAGVAIICVASGVGTALRAYSAARHGDWSFAWAALAGGAAGAVITGTLIAVFAWLYVLPQWRAARFQANHPQMVVFVGWSEDRWPASWRDQGRIRPLAMVIAADEDGLRFFRGNNLQTAAHVVTWPEVADLAAVEMQRNRWRGLGLAVSMSNQLESFSVRVSLPAKGRHSLAKAHEVESLAQRLGALREARSPLQQ